MMDIPDYLYVHTLLVEPFLTNSSHGPEFGEEVLYKAFIDDTTSLQLSRDGEEVVSSSRVFIPLNSNVPLQSRATPIFINLQAYQALPLLDKESLKDSSRESMVLDVKRRDGGNLPTPNHLEVILR